MFFFSSSRFCPLKSLDKLTMYHPLATVTNNDPTFSRDPVSYRNLFYSIIVLCSVSLGAIGGILFAGRSQYSCSIPSDVYCEFTYMAKQTLCLTIFKHLLHRQPACTSSSSKVVLVSIPLNTPVTLRQRRTNVGKTYITVSTHQSRQSRMHECLDGR